ncbi:hypothetical protein GOBAR_AA16964 [Gossypium barbadense]|uniref:Uncharacterized protein n=1 Tax=Gossypium barbadense TaxID=3634 RepID=A0A2P5XK16_GOSBA|nr:hypothetical protein GOBAR_AA16964 [Gossypium barbadense]
MKSIELPTGPITQARAKRFQEAVTSYIARVWMEGMAKHQESSSSSSFCNVLQANLARPITRARAKRFQEVVTSYIARVWMEGMAEHQESSSSSSFCNVLQANLARASSRELIVS